MGFLAAFAIAVTGSAGTEEQGGIDDVEVSRVEERQTGKQNVGGMRKVLMHIAELSVHASHHRRGLGKRLMAFFEEAVTGRSRDATSTTTFFHYGRHQKGQREVIVHKKVRRS